MMTNKKRIAKLPPANSATRQVIDRWIAQGGKIRVCEAADAYNTKSHWGPSFAEQRPRYYPACLTQILKRYGSKPAGERRKHTAWVLDPQWMPTSSPLDHLAAVEKRITQPAPVCPLPPISALLPPAPKREALPPQKKYTFEVKATIEVYGDNFAHAQAVAQDELADRCRRRSFAMEPTKIQ